MSQLHGIRTVPEVSTGIRINNKRPFFDSDVFERHTHSASPNRASKSAL